MYIPDNEELKLINVSNAGKPNHEYITLHALAHVNLASYGLILGFRPKDIVVPLSNHFFWLGDTVIDKGTWVFIYTGSGSPRFTKTNNGEPAYVMYWNNKTVLFNEDNIVPILFFMGSADLGTNRETIKQLTNTQT